MIIGYMVMDEDVPESPQKVDICFNHHGYQ